LENQIKNSNPGTFDALKSKKFRLFWTASLASVGGSQLLNLATGKLVFDLSGSEFLLGLAAAVFGIGTIIINFLGGVIADRLEKKILLIITSFSMTIVLLVLALIDAFEFETIIIVITLSSILGLISGFDWPVRSSIFTQFIDDKSQMISAVSLNAILWQGMRILAPGLGGFIIAFYGTDVVFFMSSIGFFIMGIVMIIIKPNKIIRKKEKRKSIFKDTKEGILFIYNNKLFKVIILSNYITSMIGISYLQLMPSFSNTYSETSFGDVSAQILGVLLSFAGVGAVFGTTITSRLRRNINLGKLGLSANVFSVIVLFLFGVTNYYIFEENIYANPWISYNLILSLIFIFFIGAFNSIFMVSSMSLLHLNVPENLRGRVMGIHTITFSLLSAGALFLGIVAEFLSSSVAVMIAASILIIINSLIFLKNPDVKKI